ncbi:MAG: site-2 protease family protein, partial [Clostridia bacterium]|nr:site-2 protease family protein [Clostridia bacterium]
NMFDIQNILLSVPTTLLALTIHELAHGWVSEKLGDPTPRFEGRLTLNPLAHLDLIGTIMMVLTGFGWAKPVRINPKYYKDQTKGMALTAAAGPIANFVLAILGMFIGYLIALASIHLGASINTFGTILYITQFFVMRNLCFMVFNLIPFPPLDGFKVAGLFIPKRIYYQILNYEQYIMFILMALSFSGAFDFIIGRGVTSLFNLINAPISTLFESFI